MATQSPFLLLQEALQKLSANLQPPEWAVDEVQRRMVLLLNHVLMREKEAMGRLSRQTGRVILLQWRTLTLKLVATPAGLLDRARPDAVPDLMLALTQESPLELLEAAVRGNKPAVRIEGDVQLAAEVNWLADHVRWDMEEDLSRIVGDVPAHAMGQAARRMRDALRQFMGGRAPVSPGGTQT